MYWNHIHNYLQQWGSTKFSFLVLVTYHFTVQQHTEYRSLGRSFSIQWIPPDAQLELSRILVVLGTSKQTTAEGTRRTNQKSPLNWLEEHSPLSGTNSLESRIRLSDLGPHWPFAPATIMHQFIFWIVNLFIRSFACLFFHWSLITYLFQFSIIN